MDFEQRAREMLAVQCETDGMPEAAEMVRAGKFKGDAVDGFQTTIRAIISALTPPEGYVLVPVEPTEAILRAGSWVEPPDAHGQEYIEKQGAAQCWKLMMNARPEVPDGRG